MKIEVQKGVIGIDDITGFVTESGFVLEIHTEEKRAEAICPIESAEEGSVIILSAEEGHTLRGGRHLTPEELEENPTVITLEGHWNIELGATKWCIRVIGHRPITLENRERLDFTVV